MKAVPTIAMIAALMFAGFAALPGYSFDGAQDESGPQFGPGKGKHMRLAMHGGHGHGRGLGKFKAELVEKLGLSDEQKTKMREIKVNFREKTRKARLKLRELMDEKLTMLMSGKVDQGKLAQIDEELVKSRTEVMTARLKMKRDRLAVLTPDQVSKLADALSMMPRKWGRKGF